MSEQTASPEAPKAKRSSAPSAKAKKVLEQNQIAMLTAKVQELMTENAKAREQHKQTLEHMQRMLLEAQTTIRVQARLIQ